MALDVLGKGLGFPFRFERRSGGAEVSSATSTEHEHIQESIIQILGTSPGERFMRPEFGSRLKSLVFEANDEVLKGLIRHTVIEAIKQWEKTRHRYRRDLRSLVPGDRPPRAARAHLLPRHPEPGGREFGLSLPSRAAPGSHDSRVYFPTHFRRCR